MSTLSVLMEIQADPKKAAEALEGFKGRIENITSALSGDFSGLGGDLKGALDKVAPIAGLAAAGVAAVGGAMLEMANKAAEAGEQMLHLSEQTGLTTRQLGGLKLGAQMAGLPFQELSMGFAQFARNLSPVARATSQAQLAIKALGIQTKDAHGKLLPMNTILGNVADKFAAMPDGIAKTGLAAGLFGSTVGMQLIPILDEGSKGLAKLTAKAKELGISMSTEEAERAEKFSDQMKVMRDTISGAELEIGEKLIPVMTELAKVIYEAYGFVKGFAEAVFNLAVQDERLLASLPAIRALFDGIGAAVRKLWSWLGDLWRLIEKGIELLHHFGGAGHGALQALSGFTGVGAIWKGIQGGIEGATAAAKDFNAEAAQMAALGADSAKNIGPGGMPAIDASTLRAKAPAAHFKELKGPATEYDWVMGKAGTDALNKQTEAEDRLREKEEQERVAVQKAMGVEASRSSVLAELTATINRHAQATANAGAKIYQTIIYKRTLDAVTRQLSNLYPMLTQSQIEYASNMLAANGTIQRDIELKQRSAQVTRILANATRELFDVQAISHRQQLSLNQALFQGTSGLTANTASVAHNAAGLAQQMGARRAHAAIMSIYEAAVGFGDLADLNFWGAAQAFTSSAIYAKVAGTSGGSSHGGSSHGAGGGGSHVNESARRTTAGGASGGGVTPHTVVNIQGVVSPDTMGALLPQLAAALNQGGHSGTVELASTSSSGIVRSQA